MEIALSIGLLINSVVFVYQIIQVWKKKSALKEDSTNIEGITFQDIVDKIPAHIYWKGLDGRCLGASKLQCESLGLDKKDYIGKTDFELYPQEVAERIVKVDQQMLLAGVSVMCEEVVIQPDAGEKFYLSHKIPIKNKDGKTICLLGVSIDVTDAKRKTLDKLILLDNIISAMPGNVYWMDRAGVYLGCNENQATSNGLRSRQEIIGKKNVDIPNFTPPEILDPVNQEVMRSGKIIILEEPAIYPNGNRAIFLSSKTPLRDSEGCVTGMLGISIDITEKKKAEKALEEAKEKAEAMNASALQVAHDIRSPLAAIMMLTKACAEIPEAQRVCLREAVERIQDIANQLLIKHGKEETSAENNQLSPVMVSTALLSVISSKRMEYQHSKIKLSFEASSESYFSFIKADHVEFKRMVSNLLNNAIEAYEQGVGEVCIRLNRNDNHLILTINDRGRGISEEKIQQILANDKISTEKKNGFGLGLTHTKKVLKRFNAKLNIYSSSLGGTSIELVFDLISAPEWMAKNINVNIDDCVIVLDDDQSIHGAWDEIFSEILKANPTLKLMHFSHAQECINFMNTCEDHEKILLLTDYELISQAFNGLDVIEQSRAQRAILVTSHYENQDVVQRAVRLNTKILPKMLASHVELVINGKATLKDGDLTQVSLILLDDCMMLTRAISMAYENRGKKLKVYSSPYALLEEISLYPKNVKICTDYTLNCDITGMDVAKTLHEKGFTNLYLATGYRFKQEDVPAYLRVLKDKADIVDL